MFDDLRPSDQENQSFEEAIGLGTPVSFEPAVARSAGSKGFLGLTAVQRFVLSLLLLLAVCVLGTMCLLITGRIAAF